MEQISDCKKFDTFSPEKFHTNLHFHHELR